MKDFNLAVCQMKLTYNKDENLKKAEKQIVEAAKKGAHMVVLPESFNCPYDLNLFSDYAESYPDGESIQTIRRLAQRHMIWIISGSIPEKDGDNLYNTSFVFDPSGALATRYRKSHLFDIDIPGQITFKESKVFKCGHELAVINNGPIPFGVAICFDLRYPEWFANMATQGALLVVLPAVFSPNTGPAHWEMLLRARAVDNQIYMVGAAQAPNKELGLKSHGHSMIVDPWGDILVQCQHEEAVLVCPIKVDRITQIRKQLPLRPIGRPIGPIGPIGDGS